MALVGEKTYMEWTKNGHWIKNNFNYVYINPLWKKDVPTQYSLCTFFWKSIVIGLIMMRLFVVPVGSVISLLLGRTYIPVGEWLFKQWKPTIMKHDDMFDKENCPTLGFAMTIFSMLCIILMFLTSMAMSFTVCTTYSLAWNDLGTASILYSLTAIFFTGSICGSFYGIHPEFSKKIYTAYMWFVIICLMTMLTLNALTLIGTVWTIMRFVGLLVVLIAGVVADPFVIPFEAFLVSVYFLHRSNMKSAIEFEKSCRMTEDDYLHLASSFVMGYKSDDLHAVLNRYGLGDGNDVYGLEDDSSMMNSAKYCLAKKILSSYEACDGAYSFRTAIRRMDSHSFSQYSKVIRNISRYKCCDIMTAGEYMNTLEISLIFAYAVMDDELLDSIVPEVVEKYSVCQKVMLVQCRPLSSNTLFEVVVNFFMILVEFVVTAGKYFVDVVKAKKKGYCPILNLEKVE